MRSADSAAANPAREIALRLLYDLEVQARPLDSLLDRLDHSGLDLRDRRFARQLVLGCLRWQKRLDWMVNQFSRRPVAALSPWARLLLRLGAYQIFWLDRVPERAAVHTSVELAKRFAHPGIGSLVNAVLRRLLRESEQIRYPCRGDDPVAYLAVYHSHPEWLVERWLARWGEKATEGLLQANNAPAGLYIRLNPLVGDEEDLIGLLKAEGLQPEPAGILAGYFKVEAGEGLFQSQAYARGLFQVQDVNAGLPVALLDPRPGERVLDLCSAPGGKTTQMAVAMQDRGLVVAADVAWKRLRRVRENADRLRLQSIELVVQDARRPVPARFSRVLADVPCSATGTLGRRPDARWRRTPGRLRDLVVRQETILARAFACLQKGGVLVYSTCSLEEEENAGVVERFLDLTPQAELEPAAGRFPDQSWADRYIQTLPGREPGDGSFAACIRRQGP